MSKTKSINFPLFWKFSFIAVMVVLIFGTINIFLLWSSVYRSFEKEIDRRCKALSSIIAEKSFSPIVYDDIVSIYSILDETQRSDPSIAYVFLLDKNDNVIAQTLERNIPKQLIAANEVSSGNYQIKVIEANNFKYKVIRDIAYPILGGEVGTVRLGIVEESIRKELNEATQKLLSMIFTFLVLGLGGAFFFSYLITSPIKSISEEAQRVNLDSIEKEDIEIKRPRYKKIFNFYFNDELDVLVSKFNLMIARLKNNVAELKKTRTAFVQTEKLASIGTLTSSIGHELNNPLSGIKNCIRRISKDPTNIKQNIRYLDLIAEATDKIEYIVQQLLNFSRKEKIIFDPTDPAKVLDNVIQLATFKFKKNNIQLEYKPTYASLVWASANHLEQVFLNLCLNAIDAIDERKKTMPELEGLIKIKIDCEGNSSTIRFIDNGVGIKPEVQHKIFDPFYTSKEVGKGTGLGLYVSFGIVKKHGGKLFFNSTYGQGTEFVIELPLVSTGFIP